MLIGSTAPLEEEHAALGKTITADKSVTPLIFTWPLATTEHKSHNDENWNLHTSRGKLGDIFSANTDTGNVYSLISQTPISLLNTEEDEHGEVSHLVHSPWVKTQTQIAFEHLANGKIGKALDTMMRALDKLDNDSSEALYDLFINKLNNKGYEDVANILQLLVKNETSIAPTSLKSLFDALDKNPPSLSVDIEEIPEYKNALPTYKPSFLSLG